MLHEKSELSKHLLCEVMTSDGMFKGDGLGLFSYSYHPFSEPYTDKLDIIVVTNRGQIEIIKGVPHISKQTGHGWWKWPNE